jgi:hypothetical protein
MYDIRTALFHHGTTDLAALFLKVSQRLPGSKYREKRYFTV